MQVLAYANQKCFDLFAFDGPLEGQHLGTADEVQFSFCAVSPETNPHALVLGVIHAIWGFMPSEAISFSASLIRAMGVGKPFRKISYPTALGIVRPVDGVPYLAAKGGAILRGPARMLHLAPEVTLYAA